MSRKVTTTLNDVLSMVSCADDYGHNGQIAMHFFWTLAGEKVTDDEIEVFLQQEFLTDAAKLKGYTEEDADSSREAIQEWRAKHMEKPR
jgi:hypothetical protein